MQQHRLTYRMLQRVEDGSMCLRSVGVATKKASDLPLWAAQVDAIAFACEFGHLALHMAAYDATVARRATPSTANAATHDAAEAPMPSDALDVVDFPLIPADRLVGGQAAVTATALVPANQRTLWDWIDPLLRALEIKADGTALRTFRRLFVDLYKHWQVRHAVHGAITGHDAIATAGTVTEAGGRHDTLSRVYFDARATHLLAEARAVMKHVRTVYPATGAPYGSARVP